MFLQHFYFTKLSQLLMLINFISELNAQRNQRKRNASEMYRSVSYLYSAFTVSLICQYSGKHDRVHVGHI